MGQKPPQEIYDTFYVQWQSNAEHLYACAEAIQEKYIEQSEQFRKDQAASGEIMHVKTGFDIRFLVGNGQYLLLGLALEVMFKAIWMRKQGGIVKEVPGFWKSASGHDLLKLAADIGYVPPTEEKEYLGELTGVVKCLGKYPVDFKREGVPEKTEWKVAWGLGADLFERLRGIYNTVGEEQRKAAAAVLPKPPDSAINP